jgi:hypothetical protein
MINYCKLLFDLQNITDYQILNGLEEYIGYKKETDGSLALNWHLTYIDLEYNLT